MTHSYLLKPPPHPAYIVQCVADVLLVTGFFSSQQRSIDFVTKVALGGIETVHRLALRLESVFMVEITSSDMFPLSIAPRTVFDKTIMTDEFGSDEAQSTPRKQDIVAGTTEMGVTKSVCGRRGEDRRTEVLLKARVVLEKDVAEL